MESQLNILSALKKEKSLEEKSNKSSTDPRTSSKVSETVDQASTTSVVSKISKDTTRKEEDRASQSTGSSKRVTKTPKKFEDFQHQTKPVKITQNSSVVEVAQKNPEIDEVEAQQRSSPGRYQCNECERNFKKKSHLDEHILIHAGEKPHKCEKCGWSFRRKDKMRKHMETCNYVNRETEYSAFLKPEKRKSTEDRNFKAVLTASTTSSRWVHGIFVCEVCQKDCGYRQNLYIHMKKHEKNGEWTRPTSGPMFQKLMESARAESPSDSPDVRRGRGRPKKTVDDAESADESVPCPDGTAAPPKYESPKLRKVGPIIAAKSSRTFSAPTPPPDLINEDSKDSSEAGDTMEKVEDKTPADQRTKWRTGEPPSYWVWGRYICEVCKKDCGYANNLGLHRKRSHGLTYRQEKLGYNGEIERGSKIKQNPNEPGYGTSKKKRKREEENEPQKIGQRFISKAMPCLGCEACRSDDCMQCKWCHDKKKHGGPGRLNKRCIKRRCTQPNIVEMMDHTKSRPVKMMRLEGGEGTVTYSATPVRTTYLQAGGLVKAMPCRLVRTN